MRRRKERTSSKADWTLSYVARGEWHCPQPAVRTVAPGASTLFAHTRDLFCSLTHCLVSPLQRGREARGEGWDWPGVGLPLHGRQEEERETVLSSSGSQKPKWSRQQAEGEAARGQWCTGRSRTHTTALAAGHNRWGTGWGSVKPPPGQEPEQPHQLRSGQTPGIDPPAVTANGHQRRLEEHTRRTWLSHALTAGKHEGGAMCTGWTLCRSCGRKRRPWRGGDLPGKGACVSS